MNKKKLTSAVSVSLCAILGTGGLAAFAGCDGKKVEALVVMSEELDGNFNPFFATSGADMEIVGMTQMGMLTTEYKKIDGRDEAVIACGEDQAVVVLDYETKHDDNADETVYTFVLKNNVKFSDGEPLTMNDVLFNMYVYLDPVYTGSTTMYSTDIKGLQDYRAQQYLSGNTDIDELYGAQANTRANNRILELVNLYVNTSRALDPGSTSFNVTEEQMRNAISTATLSSGYKEAISNKPEEVTNDQLLADYNLTLQYFKEELTTDYKSAKDSYTEDPYKSTGEFDEVTSFMYAEGYVTLEYAKKVTSDGRETDDRSKITKVTRNYNTSVVKDMDSAINYVYTAKVTSNLNEILSYWNTAQKLSTEYAAQAKSVLLHENLTGDSLNVPTISGIVSLGHSSYASETVSVNNTSYKLAKSHNTDGTVTNSDEYDVLQITIDGTDPKAIYNFAFTVAPQHYYGAGQEVDIANNKFGVEWGSYSFMSSTVQSDSVKVPLGAGPYTAADRNHNLNPGINDFYKDNSVYFSANENFLLGTPKTQYVTYQVVSSSNALNALEQGSVHFVTPQFTKANADKISNELKNKGIKSTDAWQLGYGYIGINAGKVTDINLRKAIMAAMNTSLSLQYYQIGTAEKIDWPMSKVSWAYPTGKVSGKDYVTWNGDEEAKIKIKKYMSAAQVEEGDSKLKIKFTIAGSNLTEHPSYATLNHAAELLNECGWQVEVIPDTNALTKLATGSLSVWAAAWGSTVDPDMYQVYHKNSTATSTYAWGYREIKNSEASYPEETTILNALSDIIDQAREIDDRTARTQLYETAMGYVLDLAIEMPVYQRKVLYAYNADVIDESTLPEEVNPYSSPLGKIWEIALKG